MGTGLGAPDVGEPEAEESVAPAPAGRKSPKKKAGLGLGRASMGSAPSDAWTRFDRNAVPDKGKAREKQDDPVCVRETERQAAASPTPSRGSPAPASPRPASPRLNSTGVSSPSAVVDLSTLLDSAGEFGETPPATDVEIDPTEQWRDGAQEADFPDEEPVRCSFFRAYACN